MSNVRLSVLLGFFFLFAAGIMFRLFSIQVTNAEFYQTRSQAQQVDDVDHARGNIFVQDSKGNLLLVATTKPFLRLYANPSKIPRGQEQELAKILEKITDIPRDILEQRLAKKSDPYEPLRDRITLEEGNDIMDAVENFKGVAFEHYNDRFYPYEGLGAHVIGFVGFEKSSQTGLYGIEKFYNSKLAQGDTDLVLTLDIALQEYMEGTLQELMNKWSSPRGSIVVMRPQDGAIIAMASRPGFNPNTYQETSEIGYFINPVVQELFEPGSIVKPLTLAAGLETEAVTPETSYIDKGYVERGGHVIKNAGERTFGKRTMKEVLQFSINTGAVFIQEQVGQKDFLRVFERLGFGRATGIDLPGELSGDITNLDSGRPINFATASYGQGISATPMQILTAFNVIANNGDLVKPHLVEKVIYQDGSTEGIEPEGIDDVISEETAAKLSAILVEVVQEGYSKSAQVPGYLIAGKTGTAQVPDPKGGYSDDRTIHSFIGFAPAFDPAFIMLIKLDAPVGVRFSSESIGPTFAKVTKHLLSYYGILPEKAVE